MPFQKYAAISRKDPSEFKIKKFSPKQALLILQLCHQNIDYSSIENFREDSLRIEELLILEELRQTTDKSKSFDEFNLLYSERLTKVTIRQAFQRNKTGYETHHDGSGKLNKPSKKSTLADVPMCTRKWAAISKRVVQHVDMPTRNNELLHAHWITMCNDLKHIAHSLMQDKFTTDHSIQNAVENNGNPFVDLNPIIGQYFYSRFEQFSNMLKENGAEDFSLVLDLYLKMTKNSLDKTGVELSAFAVSAISPLWFALRFNGNIIPNPKKDVTFYKREHQFLHALSVALLKGNCAITLRSKLVDVDSIRVVAAWQYLLQSFEHILKTSIETHSSKDGLELIDDDSAALLLAYFLGFLYQVRDAGHQDIVDEVYMFLSTANPRNLFDNTMGQAILDELIGLEIATAFHLTEHLIQDQNNSESLGQIHVLFNSLVRSLYESKFLNDSISFNRALNIENWMADEFNKVCTQTKNMVWRPIQESQSQPTKIKPSVSFGPTDIEHDVPVKISSKSPLSSFKRSKKKSKQLLSESRQTIESLAKDVEQITLKIEKLKKQNEGDMKENSVGLLSDLTDDRRPYYVRGKSSPNINARSAHFTQEGCTQQKSSLQISTNKNNPDKSKNKENKHNIENSLPPQKIASEHVGLWHSSRNLNDLSSLQLIRDKPRNHKHKHKHKKSKK